MAGNGYQLIGDSLIGGKIGTLGHAMGHKQLPPHSLTGTSLFWHHHVEMPREDEAEALIF